MRLTVLDKHRTCTAYSGIAAVVGALAGGALDIDGFRMALAAAAVGPDLALRDPRLVERPLHRARP
jgi:hypothetical protein